MNKVEDIYPSRTESEPRILKRRDPVVYGEWTPDAPLTREETERYREDGVLTLREVFTPFEVAALIKEASRLRAAPDGLEPETTITEPGGPTVRSVFKIHKQSDVFARLAADARLVMIAQFLLDDSVYQHQSRLNYKPGFHGKEFYWHSDFETWHVEDGMPRMRALSMSVLLTENVAANSPTMFLPGSHEHYVACVGETPEKHYKQSLKSQEYGVPDEDVLARFAEQRGVATPTGPAGTVVLFDCNTIHGSNSNITPLPRTNAFFVYNADSNRLVAPFGPETPRPEFIAAREDGCSITPLRGSFENQAAERGPCRNG